MHRPRRRRQLQRLPLLRSQRGRAGAQAPRWRALLGTEIAEHGAEATFDAIGDGLSTGAEAAGDALGDAGEHIAEFAADAGEWFVDAADSAGDFIMDLF